MNYYPHHIGDYITATAHLSMLEHGAYRTLLDLYYSTEKPLPAERKAVYRLARARAPEEQEAVDIILDEFFDEASDGWRHARCDEEIEKARVAVERSRANGKKGGRPRKQEPNDNPTGSSDDGNGNPPETQQVISGLAKQNPDETQGEPRENLTPKPPLPITQEPIPKKEEAAATPPPRACVHAPAHEAEPLAAPPDAPEIPAEPPESPRPPIPDDAPKRATQIAVLLRRNGADPRTAPNDRHIADWARDNVTDAQVLQALETAKARRKAQGSDQPIGTAYLSPIIADIRVAPPEAPSPSSGNRRDRYARDAEQIQAMARWADEQLRQGNADAQFPRIEE
ncbi:DUF1376 domain-containing protein [Castellaniella ginsengisoli]|uniref:DUF1376 domain-containing protein n=1 Tax=Castellaniella ginsengisoli TaxID=546114 RepID=A0AB39G494_9BURK